MIDTQDQNLRVYAQALIELTDANGTTADVASDVASIAQVIEAEPSLGQYLSDPSIGHGDRLALLERAFDDKINPTLMAFLKLLSERGRVGQFAGIARVFATLMDARSGNLEVEVTVPTELDAAGLEEVRHEVSTKLGKNARVTQKVDESLIGGLILKIGDTMIDGSVATQLKLMKRRLISAI